jgi:hypothetical protein
MRSLRPHHSGDLHPRREKKGGSETDLTKLYKRFTIYHVWVNFGFYTMRECCIIGQYQTLYITNDTFLTLWVCEWLTKICINLIHVHHLSICVCVCECACVRARVCDNLWKCYTFDPYQCRMINIDSLYQYIQVYNVHPCMLIKKKKEKKEKKKRKHKREVLFYFIFFIAFLQCL